MGVSEDAQREVPRDQVEISIIGEEVQIVTDSELGENGVDSVNLHAFLSTRTLQGGRNSWK